MTTRVLVTGGHGFVGRYVIDQLLAAHPDVTVRALDLTPVDLPGTEWVRGSILDANVLSEAVRGTDIVLHMAAMLGVRRTEGQRLGCLSVNIAGTVNLLDACVKEGVRKVVMMSSSEVYGDQERVPISEDNPVQPKSVYAVTKLAGEEYARAYHQRYGLDFSVVRFFNVFGAGQVGEFVVSRFCKAVMEGKPPTIYGDGDQIRAFNYASDAARGVLDSAFSDAANGEILNIGNDTEPISMADLARRVIKVAGSDLEPIFVPFAESDRTADREVVRRIPDISKARRVLGYEPRVTLDEGIGLVLEGGAISPSWTETSGVGSK